MRTFDLLSIHFLVIHCTATLQPVYPFRPTLTEVRTKPGSQNVQSFGGTNSLVGQKYSRRRGHHVVVPMVPLMSIGRKRKTDSMESSEAESSDERSSASEEQQVSEETEEVDESQSRADSDWSKDDASYKLIYFDARGICESIRLLFIYANVSFEDKRITKNEWLRMKESTDFGRIPILEVNGRRLSHCMTISRFLGRRFDMDGTSEWEKAKIDEISEFHREVAQDISPYFYVLGGYRNGNVDQMRKNVFLPAVEKHFPVYVKLLRNSKTGFFGRKPSWVDFTVGEFMYTIKNYEPLIVKKFPAIVKFLDRLYHLPQIRPYIKTRSKTPLI